MATGWTTADYALIVSIFALTITIGNFVWNVWSKFIFPKPRVEVRLSFVVSPLSAPGSGSQNWPRALCLSAVNHGPGQLQLMAGIGRMKRTYPWKQPLGAVFKGYNNWPNDSKESTVGGPGMPKRLDVGDKYVMFLHPVPNHYNDMKSFGFSDTFGRSHWANARSIRLALASSRKNS
jgi:hypothetical protein